MNDESDFHTLQKIKTFEEWMADDHVLVHLDSRLEEVSVPSHLTGNPALTLKLSYLFQGETTHDDFAITSYLKFSGEYFKCVLPWSAVWGLTSATEENKIWPEDLPRELVFQFAKAKVKELGTKLLGAGAKKDDDEQDSPSDTSLATKPDTDSIVTKIQHKPKLSSIDGASEKTKKSKVKSPSPKSPHLTRIK